jgi:aminoglycoside phosphotransferase
MILQRELHDKPFQSNHYENSCETKINTARMCMIIHNVADHHFQHEWQGLAAMSLH